MKATHQFTFHLRHDAGTAIVRIFAENMAGALHKLTESEGCPERAIFKVTIKHDIGKTIC